MHRHPPTLDALLTEAVVLLHAARVPHPRREATRLWADLAGSSIGAVHLARPAAVSVPEAERFLAAVERRARGEPLPYVTGRVGFRRLELTVDSRVLIPRPETEGLVELVLHRGVRGTIADVGTGSGCIALSLRQEAHPMCVVATDRSAGALEVARANATALGLDVLLVRGSLSLPLATASLDALVSNPPYIAREEYLALDESVRLWEPATALQSGEDGLDATRVLLQDGRRVLRPGGLLALEVDASRAALVGEMAAQLGWVDVQVQLDLFGRARYLVAHRRSDP
jgi:release factor glutamine methyltransferase